MILIVKTPEGVDDLRRERGERILFEVGVLLEAVQVLQHEVVQVLQLIL